MTNEHGIDSPDFFLAAHSDEGRIEDALGSTIGRESRALLSLGGRNRREAHGKGKDDSK